jgi:hypothetical protein
MDDAVVTKSKSLLAQSRRVVSDIAVDDGEMRMFSVAGNTVRFRWRESPQLFDGWWRWRESEYVRQQGIFQSCLCHFQSYLTR